VNVPTLAVDQAEHIVLRAVLTEADRLLALIDADLAAMQQTIHEMGTP
jgi:hypothetical protein